MIKVLVVDDAKIMRNILKKTITERYSDFHIIEARDGHDAIDLYKKEKPSLVTMDITMERKNGLDAAKEILEIDKNAKIVMVTSLGQEKMLSECVRVGVRDYIVKPFSKERILSSISTALGENKEKNKCSKQKRNPCNH
jgi:two-component system chemotaxis response regulator CheY